MRPLPPALKVWQGMVRPSFPPLCCHACQIISCCWSAPVSHCSDQALWILAILPLIAQGCQERTWLGNCIASVLRLELEGQSSQGRDYSLKRLTFYNCQFRTNKNTRNMQVIGSFQSLTDPHVVEPEFIVRVKLSHQFQSDFAHSYIASPSVR